MRAIPEAEHIGDLIDIRPVFDVDQLWRLQRLQVVQYGSAEHTDQHVAVEACAPAVVVVLVAQSGDKHVLALFAQIRGSRGQRLGVERLPLFGLLLARAFHGAVEQLALCLCVAALSDLAVGLPLVS